MTLMNILFFAVIAFVVVATLIIVFNLNGSPKQQNLGSENTMIEQPKESFGDYDLMPRCQNEDEYLANLARGICNCWPKSSITQCAEWSPNDCAGKSLPLYRYVSPDMLMGRKNGRINIVARRQLYP